MLISKHEHDEWISVQTLVDMEREEAGFEHR